MKCMAVLRTPSRRLVHCTNQAHRLYERTRLCNEHYVEALRRAGTSLQRIAESAREARDQEESKP